MKPYIAILVDSFWEALGNRILWVLLLGWALILLALAPFGYISERSYRLTSYDIDNSSSIIEKLAKAAKGQGSPDVLAVAQNLPPDFFDRMQQESGGTPSRALSQNDVAQALNEVLEARELYSAEAFPSAIRRERLKPLIEGVDGLPADELEQLNRELLKLAFPLELRSPRAEQLYIGYAGFKLGSPLPSSRRQISLVWEPILLSLIIKLGLGVVAIFVALLVTSSIIPETFRAGSLHLLLSKPISRVWLFLSKFLGGCIFVLFNISFFLIGLYFIAGFRLDMWNSGLLACIPLLMFVFVIFYSVSALAGLVWGNAIVSVVACMIFWLFCTGVGLLNDVLQPQVEILPQIASVRRMADNTLTVNQRGQLSVWNQEFSVWQPALEIESFGQTTTFAPIYNADRDMLIAKSFVRDPFRVSAPSRQLSLIRLGGESRVGQTDSSGASIGNEAMSDDASRDDSSVKQSVPEARRSADSSPRAPANETRVDSLSSARRTPRWTADLGPEVPAQVFDMLECDDAIVAVCRGGIYRLDMQMLDAVQVAESGFLGFKLPWVSTQGFQKVSPPDLFMGNNTTAASVTGGPGMLVYSDGKLDVLQLENNSYIVSRSLILRDLKTNASDADEELADDVLGVGNEGALTRINQQFCVLARAGFPILLLNAQLEFVSEITLPVELAVRQIEWVPGTNRLSIVSHTGGLWMLDCETSSLSESKLPVSGECSCLNWLDSDRVLLGLKPNRVSLVNLSAGTVEQTYDPTKTTLEWVYGTFVKPLYTVNPKPRAMDEAMTYVLTGSETVNLELNANDLESAQQKLSIWPPILSNLAFVILILGISCVYVARKEY